MVLESKRGPRGQPPYKGRSLAVGSRLFGGGLRLKATPGILLFFFTTKRAWSSLLIQAMTTPMHGPSCVLAQSIGSQDNRRAMRRISEIRHRGGGVPKPRAWQVVV